MMIDPGSKIVTYMDGYPSCCEARECTTVEPPPCDLVNDANATETTGNTTSDSGGEEVEGLIESWYCICRAPS